MRLSKEGCIMTHGVRSPLGTASNIKQMNKCLVNYKQRGVWQEAEAGNIKPTFYATKIRGRE